MNYHMERSVYVLLLWSQLLLSSAQIITVNNFDDDFLDEWTPSWTCLNGRCVKNDYELIRSSEQSSLDICRLTCGQYGSLWPKPTGEVLIGSNLVAFHPSQITFIDKPITQETETYIEAITYLFVKRLTKLCGSNCTDIPNTNLKGFITINDNVTELSTNVDEGYSLRIGTVQEKDNVLTGTDKTIIIIELSSKTVFGIRHGLETLYQLVTKNIASTNLVMASNVSILNDIPFYKHRGLVLDTARHFISMSSIKRQLDAMSMNKMNVFHWHTTDTHSFPLVLKSVPQLSRYGAYSKSRIYTPSEISHLIYYAKLRGIRVIFELDAPAHAGNGWQWGPKYGLGDLVVCLNQQPWRHNCIQPPCGQLNPINPNVYSILRDIYAELSHATSYEYGDSMFHMGADEVFLPCWNNTPAIQDFMISHGKGTAFSDYLNLWAHFQNKAAEMFDEAVGHNRTKFVIWSSHLTNPLLIENYLSKDRYIIQTWVPKRDPLADILLSKGYQVIISTKDAWYLDHGFWGLTTYYRWQHVYENMLPNSPNVLGGEVAMWTEYVDEENLDGRIWPRTAAAAERLWSNPKTSSQNAEIRFLQQRERLVHIGIRAEVTTPEWCYLHDGECG